MSQLAQTELYNSINDRIDALKNKYPFLIGKNRDYIFSALCIKSLFYKDPSNILEESTLIPMITDGSYDGGFDFILNDPDSENEDLILGQAKYYKDISKETILEAFQKMFRFYKNLSTTNYKDIRDSVITQFENCSLASSDDANIRFVLCTSAQKPSRLKLNELIDSLNMQIRPICSNAEISIFFSKDLYKEIQDAEATRPYVDSGLISIDSSDNILKYEESIIVNVSAASIKKIYSTYRLALLSQNLRYFYPSKTVDSAIKRTIEKSPDEFWYRSNGITIICDSYEIKTNTIALTNFSIINGGQTTRLLADSNSINADSSFFLQCKIIKSKGTTTEEKTRFATSIAEATNNQKPIKASDLKANSSEQLRLAASFRLLGIQYITKRGDTVSPECNQAYLNTKLDPLFKLFISGIFQRPCEARNSSLGKEEDAYDSLFCVEDYNPDALAKIGRDLLYINYYYDKRFRPSIQKKEGVDYQYEFAQNARTINIAFVALFLRVYLNNVSGSSIVEDFQKAYNGDTDSLKDHVNNTHNLSNGLLGNLYDKNDFTKLDNLLKCLFRMFIDEVHTEYARVAVQTTATNFLKNKSNYYLMIAVHWHNLWTKGNNILNDMNVELF